MLTQEIAREWVHYDPDTGLLTWRKSRGGKTRAGSPFGSRDARGYIDGRLFNTRVRAHRLAWLWMTGRMPLHQIDHIDGNRRNNAWANLREATHTQNLQNQRGKGSATGLKGVFAQTAKRGRRTGRYRAQITVAGKRISLGVFETPQEAHAAYSTAALTHYGQFARLS